MHIPKKTDRYAVWSKILAKHEKKWREERVSNLDALWSNHCQAMREVRKGRMTEEQFADLENRYLKLKEAIENGRD